MLFGSSFGSVPGLRRVIIYYSTGSFVEKVTMTVFRSVSYLGRLSGGLASTPLRALLTWSSLHLPVILSGSLDGCVLSLEASIIALSKLSVTGVASKTWFGFTDLPLARGVRVLELRMNMYGSS